jgi:hypothetical protein
MERDDAPPTAAMLAAEGWWVRVVALVIELSKLAMGLWLVLSVSVEYRDTVPEFVRDTKCSFLWGENWKASTADVCWKVGRTAPPSFPVFESGTTEMFLSLLRKAKWVEEQDNKFESPTGMYGESSE